MQSEITQMENDLRTLFYRLVLVDKYTHSPETLEVMERLAPKYMENMKCQYTGGRNDRLE